jgi:UDP-sugar pyrophosphorylase
LLNSKNGVNPLDGWTPDVPSGIILDPFSSDFLSFESEGLKQLGCCGFVLVAGGLGERLGYSGIKIDLPVEMVTRTSYIKLYCQSILAIQERFSHSNVGELPLAIMVSDDTESKTIELLKRNSYFGLNESQVVVLKQEKVPSLMDNDAHIALSGPYEIDSKPHGHGDVHSLMHVSGTAALWAKRGIKWAYFFQDTNGLAFLSLPAHLGVSIKLELEVNSLAVPRLAAYMNSIVQIEALIIVYYPLGILILF